MMAKAKKLQNFTFMPLEDFKEFLLHSLSEKSNMADIVQNSREMAILKELSFEDLNYEIKVAYDSVSRNLSEMGVHALTKRQSKSVCTVNALLEIIIGSLVAKHNKLKIHLDAKNIYFDNHHLIMIGRETYPMIAKFVTEDLNVISAIIADYVAKYHRNTYSVDFFEKINFSGGYAEEFNLGKQFCDKIDLLEFRKLNNDLENLIAELIEHVSKSKAEVGFNSSKTKAGKQVVEFENFLKSVHANLSSLSIVAESEASQKELLDEIGEQLEDLSILLSNQLRLFKSSYPYAHSFNLSIEKFGLFDLLSKLVLTEECFVKEKKIKEVFFCEA